MWRLIVVGALLALAMRPLPAAAQDGCPGDTPEDTASVLFGEYLASGQWYLPYQPLPPESQTRIPGPIFAGAQQARAAFGPILDVEVFPARMAPGWTWGITGVRFTGVAEVPVRFARARGPGVVPELEVVPLVLVGSCWRWLPVIP